MKPQHENFVELRRLLALKRYEQPPPGYFETFHREVLGQIRVGKQSTSVFDALSREGSWIQRLWSSFESRPIYAGGFGLAVCGLLLAGVLLSENSDPTLMAAPTVPPAGEAGFSLATQLEPPSGVSLFQRAGELEQRPKAFLISAPGTTVP